MRIRRIGILVLAVLFGVFAAVGCKSEDEPKTEEPQPTQTFGMQTGNNPLTNLLVEQTNHKDALLGEMAELLDSYEPKANEPDYTDLTVAVLTPFTEADGFLADVLVLSFYMEAQPDGSYSYAGEGEEASLVQAGLSYAYSGNIADATDAAAYQRQNASFLSDGSRITVQVFDNAQDRDEIEILNMQWVREGGATRVQCCYTTNKGESYNILRYRTEEAALTFALYEEVDQMPDLFSLAAQDLFAQGYITYGVYANGTVTIENQSHTLVVGP